MGFEGATEHLEDLDDRVEVGLSEWRGSSECVDSLEEAEVWGRDEEVEGRLEEAMEAVEEDEGGLLDLCLFSARSPSPMRKSSSCLAFSFWISASSTFLSRLKQSSIRVGSMGTEIGVLLSMDEEPFLLNIRLSENRLGCVTGDEEIMVTGWVDMASTSVYLKSKLSTDVRLSGALVVMNMAIDRKRAL